MSGCAFSERWDRSKSDAAVPSAERGDLLAAHVCQIQRCPNQLIGQSLPCKSREAASSVEHGSGAAMTVKLYAFTCGTVTGEFGRLMEGGEGDITLPVPVFLIEHPKGQALFDTGLHPDCQHDPAGRLGSRLAGLFRIGFKPGEEVSARLEAIDRDPAHIDLVINSHFHFDHVGGNGLIPNATMLVQRREWDAGMDPDTAARHGYNPRDFDLGHKLRLLDGEHDVFGDGAVVCLPTHGHTPGI